MYQKFLQLVSCLALGTRRVFVALMLVFLVSACSPSQLLSSVLGGGGVNANANIGKEVTQGVQVNSNVTREAPKVSVAPEARVDNIDQRTVNNTEIDPLLLALLVIGWLAPSPGEIVRGVKNMFKRK